MNNSYYINVFFQLLRRDIYTFAKRFINYGINFFLISPILIITVFGYIQPTVYFKSSGSVSITLIVGSLIFNMILLCSNFINPIIFDLETDRFIDYQLLLLPPFFLLLKIILFPAVLASLLSFPFFILSYLVLPGFFEGLVTHWGALTLVLCLSALTAASYIMLAMSIIKTTSGIRKFWLCVNWPLACLGGLWTPWYLVHSKWPFLSFFILANPILYMTEGVRSALTGSNHYIHYSVCIFTLMGFSCIFIVIASFFFKNKVDHI